MNASHDVTHSAGTLRRGRRAAKVLLAALLVALGTGATIAAGAANASAAGPDTSPSARLEAEMKAVAAATRGKWVEMPTLMRGMRRFVAVLEDDAATAQMLIHMRVDWLAPDEANVASFTDTMRLDCPRASTRVIASYGYDEAGKQLFAKLMPQAPPTPIDSPTGGPYQMLCAGTYLLPLIPDGFRRFSEAMAEQVATRVSIVADRPIPLPAPR